MEMKIKQIVCLQSKGFNNPMSRQAGFLLIRLLQQQHPTAPRNNTAWKKLSYVKQFGW